MASRRPLPRDEQHGGDVARTPPPGDVRRRVLTDLPDRLGVVPHEAELLHHHLRDCLAALFAGHADQPGVEPGTVVDDRRRKVRKDRA